MAALRHGAQPEQLPIEDPEHGLYLHREVPGTPGTRVTRIIDADGAERYLVNAAQFMECQRERDGYRRALGLIAAWRVSKRRSEETLKRLLADAGFDDAQAQALLDVVRHFRPDALP